jgi:hypothetical protein
MFPVAIGDPEARRLAQQLKEVNTRSASVKAFSERAVKPKKSGSPGPARTRQHTDAEEALDRFADASFGLVVTQLQVRHDGVQIF